MSVEDSSTVAQPREMSVTKKDYVFDENGDPLPVSENSTTNLEVEDAVSKMIYETVQTHLGDDFMKSFLTQEMGTRNSLIADQFGRAFTKQLQRKKRNVSVKIKWSLDDSEYRKLSSMFPDLDIETGNVPHGHAFAAAANLCSRRLAIQFLGIRPNVACPDNVPNVIVKSVGGKPEHYYYQGLYQTHVCSPILDNSDKMRNSNTHLMASRDEVFAAYLERFGNQAWCHDLSQECMVTSKYVLFEHSTYDIAPVAFMRTLVNSQCDSALAVFWMPLELLDLKLKAGLRGKIQVAELYWEIFERKNVLYIQFYFADGSQSYVHLLDHFLHIVTMRHFVLHGLEYVGEVVYYRNGLMMMQWNKVLSPIHSSIASRQEWREIHFSYGREYFKITGYVHGLDWAPSHWLFPGLVLDLKKKMQRMTLIVPREFWNKVYGHALSLGDGSFLPKNIMAFAVSLATQHLIIAGQHLAGEKEKTDVVRLTVLFAWQLAFEIRWQVTRSATAFSKLSEARREYLEKGRISRFFHDIKARMPAFFDKVDFKNMQKLLDDPEGRDGTSMFYKNNVVVPGLAPKVGDAVVMVKLHDFIVEGGQYDSMTKEVPMLLDEDYYYRVAAAQIANALGIESKDDDCSVSVSDTVSLSVTSDVEIAKEANEYVCEAEMLIREMRPDGSCGFEAMMHVANALMIFEGDEVTSFRVWLAEQLTDDSIKEVPCSAVHMLQFADKYAVSFCVHEGEKVQLLGEGPTVHVQFTAGDPIGHWDLLLPSKLIKDMDSNLLYTYEDLSNKRDVCEIPRKRPCPSRFVNRGHAKLVEMKSELTQGLPEKMRVADLGSAPGGFAHAFNTSEISTYHASSVEGIEFGELPEFVVRSVCDFRAHKENLGINYHLVLCDMAVDDESHDRSVANNPLLMKFMNVVPELMAYGGNLLMKVFSMRDLKFRKMIANLAENFREVGVLKPESSNICNDEKYLVFRGWSAGVTNHKNLCDRLWRIDQHFVQMAYASLENPRVITTMSRFMKFFRVGGGEFPQPVEVEVIVANAPSLDEMRGSDVGVVGFQEVETGNPERIIPDSPPPAYSPPPDVPDLINVDAVREYVYEEVDENEERMNAVVKRFPSVDLGFVLESIVRASVLSSRMQKRALGYLRSVKDHIDLYLAFIRDGVHATLCARIRNEKPKNAIHSSGKSVKELLVNVKDKFVKKSFSANDMTVTPVRVDKAKVIPARNGDRTDECDDVVSLVSTHSSVPRSGVGSKNLTVAEKCMVTWPTVKVNSFLNSAVRRMNVKNRRPYVSMVAAAAEYLSVCHATVELVERNFRNFLENNLDIDKMWKGEISMSESRRSDNIMEECGNIKLCKMMMKNNVKCLVGVDDEMHDDRYVFDRSMDCLIKRGATKPDEIYFISNESAILTEYDIYTQNCSRFLELDKLKSVIPQAIEGVPGCGKTTSILNAAQDGDVILSATKEGSIDIDEKIREMGKNVKVYTIDKFLMLGMPRVRGKLHVDEFLMKHRGAIALLTLMSGAQKVFCYGDMKQIPYIERKQQLASLEKYAGWDDFIVRKSFVAHTYRCPRDVTNYLSSVYGKSVTTTNEVNYSMSLQSISTENELRMCDDVLYMVFTQGEKEMLTALGKRCNVKIKVATIHEMQGKSVSKVWLVRTAMLRDNAIYKSLPHILVALSRHTKEFRYFTVNLSDEVSNIVRKYTKSGGGRLWSVRELELVQRYEKQLQFSPAESTVEFVSGFGINFGPGKDLGVMRWSPSYFDVLNAYDDVTVEELQSFYDLCVPGASVADSEAFGKLSAVAPVLVGQFTGKIDPTRARVHPQAWSYMKPKLRTSMIPPRRATLDEELLAAAKRNCDVPMMTDFPDPYGVAAELFDQFCNVFIDDSKMANLCGEINVSCENVEKWYVGQGDDIRERIELPSVASFIDMSKYEYMMKMTSKPVMLPGDVLQYPPVQTIAAHPKYLNAFFCPIVRAMKERVIYALKPNVLLFMDMHPSEFAKAMDSRFPYENESAVEADISKYDKSQGLLALLFECKMMKFMGVPESVVAMWFNAHVATTLRSFKTGLRMYVPFQRKSGDAMTLLGNTLFNMAVCASSFRMENAKFSVFVGDDSVIWGRDLVRKDQVVYFEKRFNLSVKVLFYRHVHFCSKFLIRVNDQWVFFPDPLKLLTKLGRHDVRDREQLEEYRESLLDLFCGMNNVNVFMRVAEAVSERYAVPADLTVLIGKILRLLSSKSEFHSLFDYERGASMLRDPTRRRLE